MRGGKEVCLMGATATREKAESGLPEGAAVFEFGDREQVCVQAVECDGRPMVTVRLLVFDEDAERWVPRRGLALTPELAEEVAVAMLERARVALGQAEA